MTLDVAPCTAGAAFAQPSQLEDHRATRSPPPSPRRTLARSTSELHVRECLVRNRGAVGLRNRGEGGVAISGVTTPVQRAFAYWAVVTTSPTAAASNIYLKRGVANGPFTNIAGIPIGHGRVPVLGRGSDNGLSGNDPARSPTAMAST